MKSIYNHLVKWGEDNPDSILLDYNKGYSVSDVLYEVDAISKSLEYIPDYFIGIYLSSPADIIFLYFWKYSLSRRIDDSKIHYCDDL